MTHIEDILSEELALIARELFGQPIQDTTPWYGWESTTPRASWAVRYERQKRPRIRQDKLAYFVGLYKRETKNKGDYTLVKEWYPATIKTRRKIVNRLFEQYPPQ